MNNELRLTQYNMIMVSSLLQKSNRKIEVNEGTRLVRSRKLWTHTDLTAPLEQKNKKIINCRVLKNISRVQA